MTPKQRHRAARESLICERYDYLTVNWARALIYKHFQLTLLGADEIDRDDMIHQFQVYAELHEIKDWFVFGTERPDQIRFVRKEELQ